MGTGGQKARDLTGNNRGHFGCFGLKIKYLNGGIHKMDVFLKSKVKRCSYDTVISICLIAFCFENDSNFNFESVQLTVIDSYFFINN